MLYDWHADILGTVSTRIRNFRPQELSSPGTKVPWNFRPLELSFPASPGFVP